MNATDEAGTEPVQRRDRGAGGHDPSLDALYDWGRAEGCWYAEQWPIVPELPVYDDASGLTSYTPTRIFEAIAIGRHGIVAVQGTPSKGTGRGEDTSTPGLLPR